VYFFYLISPLPLHTALIFGVVSNQLNDIYELSPRDQVWAILIVEHTVILAKLFIMWVIPDVPGHVRRGLALRKFQQNIILGEGDVPGDEWTINPEDVDDNANDDAPAAVLALGGKKKGKRDTMDTKDTKDKAPGGTQV
jgi:hypothetical protein